MTRMGFERLTFQDSERSFNYYTTDSGSSSSYNAVSKDSHMLKQKAEAAIATVIEYDKHVLT